MTFWNRASNFPPILCRLLARQKYSRPLTTEEIAQGAGLSPAEVISLSMCTSWSSVSYLFMSRFLTGCRMDFCDTGAMRRVDDYISKRPTFRYLRASPDWQDYYLPLLQRWRRSYRIIEVDTHPPIRALLIRLSPLLK